MIFAALLLASSLASPFITFDIVDDPGSAIYCFAESVTYNAQNTLIVDASSCIPDRIFTDGFDNKLEVTPHQDRNQP